MAEIPVLEKLSQYRVLLPVLFLFTIFLLYRLYKIRPPLQLNLFLNILLLIYTGIEGWKLGRLSGAKTASASAGMLVRSGSLPPDIFYIVPDCYPSSGFQQSVLGVTENQLDSELRRRGFYIISDPRSNYKYTAFSMASVFNMDYIGWLNDVNVLRPFHYNKATSMVGNSRVITSLKENGYELVNLSVFDLPGQPSMKKERFLSTTGTEIIFYNTFYKCLRRDVIPELIPSLRDDHQRQQRRNNRKLLQNFRDYNQIVLDSLGTFNPNNSRPRFVYAHLEMPHFPYFYDSIGNAYPEQEIFGSEMITHRERFKNYIGYTNAALTRLVDTLKARHGRNAIIVIQSDHGLNDIAGSKREDAFRNYSALYFPDSNYRSLYPGMSNVNTFRIIFNQYFGQRLPLLPDSSIYNR